MFVYVEISTERILESENRTYLDNISQKLKSRSSGKY